MRAARSAHSGSFGSLGRMVRLTDVPCGVDKSLHGKNAPRDGVASIRRAGERPEDAVPARVRPLRIVIVDDHPIVRKGLVQLIDGEPDLTVCGESGDPEGALAVIGAETPDVAVVDLSLGTGSGLDLVKALAASHPAVRVLVLSMRDELLYAEGALRAGARGYIMKQAAPRELLAAIRQVASGRSYVSERMAERIHSGVQGRATAATDVLPMDRLTAREREVFELIGHGVGRRDIARRLNMALKTVESHIAHIKEKLGLTSGRELMRVAVIWTESL
jgi:DNA-binding NarL/FixJ family response regulator